MIRRRLGNSFLLVRQTDHAAIAGQLAEQLGTSRYHRPTAFTAFVAATRLHDSGWPVHDDAPRLDDQGYPMDLFEMPRELDLACWSGAPGIAASHGPRAELLVSLHILALSGYLAARPGEESARARFDINKFQHREMERQEGLRKALGLSLETPLTMGLAEEGASPGDDELRRDLRWLQAMDLISLAACCQKPPVDHTLDVYPDAHPGGEPLWMHRQGDDVVVKPWPFGPEGVRLEIPGTLVPARAYVSAADLHAEIARGSKTVLPSEVRPY